MREDYWIFEEGVYSDVFGRVYSDLESDVKVEFYKNDSLRVVIKKGERDITYEVHRAMKTDGIFV